MEDAWQRKRETQGSNRWRNGERAGGGSKGKRTKKFEQRKKNSRRLALSRDVTSILCPSFPALSRIGYAQRRGIFRPGRMQCITFPLPSDNAPLFRSLCIISPLIKEHGWICEFMHTTVTEAVLVKSTRVSIPAERSPIMLGIQPNDFVSVW